ncbi:hypothetical protein [Neobacillus sp. NPDC093127]|uniref:hypothetical protein n=1 Tax=Neobacillus sp. NPDC093127 TaxID=3364296 RepID=UPI003804082D
MKNNLIELMVKHNGSIFRMEKETGLSKDEIIKGFDELKLKQNTRKIFIWKLAALTEKMIYENPFSSNSDIAEIVLKEWNAKEEIKITRETAQAYLQKSSLRLDNSKRAFQALCHEDIESYKLFSQNDALFFSELLTRFGLYFTDKFSDTMPLAILVLPALFENPEVESLMNKALSKLGFKGGKNKINFDAMKLYKKNFDIKEAVFAKGLYSIIFPILVANHEKEEVNKIYGNLKAFCWKQENEGGESDYSVDFLDFDAELEATPVEVIHEVAPKAKEETELKQEQEVDPQTPTKQEEPEELKRQTHDTLMVKLSLLSAAFQESVTEAVAEYIQASPQEEKQDSYIAQLEEENKRLYVHIDKMEQEREVLQDRKITEFLKLIGGQESRYLLSDLYEDSVSEVHFGKVKNLFNFFQMFGIEPFNYGFKLGEEVTVTKQELAQKYNLSGVLGAVEQEIKVRIVRHGWLLNDKVIVLPLVEEVSPIKQ